MTDRSSVIFGNKMPDKVYKKAVKSKKKYMKKFGDDSRKNYEVAVEKNRYIGDSLGVYNILVGNLAENAHYDVNAHAEKGTFDTEKGIIVGNIRMGFGHYRISMAMASAAKAMGYTPYWMDLNSYGETTCTKVIGAQNDLYSLGSRLSKNPIFNKLVWEPMNYEGFRALSYNAADQKNAELMAPVYRNVPKDIPVIGTHVWPAHVHEVYGYDTYAPYSGDTFDLVTGEQIADGSREMIEKKKNGSSKASSNVFARLLAAGQRLLEVINKCEGLPNKELAKFADQINALCDKWSR